MSEFIEDYMRRRRESYPLESEENRARLRSQLEGLEERTAETRQAVAAARQPAMVPVPADSVYAIGYQNRLGVGAPIQIEDHIVRYGADGKPYGRNPEMVARAAAADAEARRRQQAWLDAHEVYGTGVFRAYAWGPGDAPPPLHGGA